MNSNLLKRRKNIRALKWVAAVFLIITLILIGISWYINIRFRPLIRKELQELVHRSTNGLYRISFSTLNFNLITGSATINDVQLVPDQRIYNDLIHKEKAPDNLYYIRLKQLSVNRFHPFLLYKEKKAAIDLLLFEKPIIVMVNKHFAFNDNRPPRPRQSPYDYVARLLKSLHVAVIDFRQVNFKYVDNNGIQPVSDSVANLNVTLMDWLIDPHSAQDTTRFYLLKDVDVNLSNYRYATPDNMYFINLNQLDFNAASGTVKIKQLGLNPRYSEDKFQQVNGYARDRYDLTFNQISINGFNLPAYLRQRSLIAREVNITGGTIAVSNNNSYPKRKNDKTGRFPHQLLQKLKLPLLLSKVVLNDIDISYAEFDQRSKLKGKITFQKTAGVLTNVTNIAKEKAINPVLEANLSSHLMNQGKLALSFRFDLNSALGAFTYKGSLGQMDGKRLNAMIKPLGMLQVNKGKINQLDFDIKADQHVAKGKLSFRFNELSVKLLKKEEGKDRLVKKGLLSILANALIIYSDNPSRDGKFTSADINFHRQPTSSFFSYIWRSLYQGIKYSVGVTPQKEAEIRAHIARFEQMKDDRQERRYRRHLRKEKREQEKYK